MLTKGLRWRQVNFSCEESHDRHKKTGGAGAVWVSLIDFGFSQQSMFRCWHLCLNEAAPSIKARGRGLSAAANQCSQTECFSGLMRPLSQKQRGRRGRVENAIFYFFFRACCRCCLQFDSDGRRRHDGVKKMLPLRKRKKEAWDNWRHNEGRSKEGREEMSNRNVLNRS